MRRRIALAISLLLFCHHLYSQMTPWLQWSFLPPQVLDEIIGETSGENAWYTILENAGYDRDRTPAEYDSLFRETQYFYDKIRSYRLPQAELVRFPGGTTWDGIAGDLWEVSPLRQKLASYLDHTVMLASGSSNADVKTRLVWVGSGSKEELERAEVKGKIVFTDAPVSFVHARACLDLDAAGVLSMYSPQSHFDPIQLPWGRVSGDPDRNLPARFGFLINPREGEYLKRRLLAGDSIIVHAQVRAENRPYTIQDLICAIPGTDPTAGEIILSAHLFEGYVKQGGNDNLSGSAAILEVARVLNTLIEQGRIARPRRTIRFIWAPEFSGTIPWVSANREIINRTLCNINLDMVGEWLSKNKSFMCLMRTSYGNPHFVNDVVENFYRFVGEGNRERIQNRGNFYAVPRRIVAPMGSDEPFPYSIETHYGASDHEVFNDWSVRVPGVMMIAWPDQWYHTSGDHADKSDPTQLRRAVVIAAASAYAIAAADAEAAHRIAAEIFSNALRRLGHQQVRAFERVNSSTIATFGEDYKLAMSYIESGFINEVQTLQTINELAPSDASLRRTISDLQEQLGDVWKSLKQALEDHMERAAKRIGVKPASLALSPREKEASRLIPRTTDAVTNLGMRGVRADMEKLPKDVRDRYSVSNRVTWNSSELHALINGLNSVLDIQKLLNAQSPLPAPIDDVLNYVRLLEAMKLVTL